MFFNTIKLFILHNSHNKKFQENGRQLPVIYIEKQKNQHLPFINELKGVYIHIDWGPVARSCQKYYGTIDLGIAVDLSLLVNHVFAMARMLLLSTSRIDITTVIYIHISKTLINVIKFQLVVMLEQNRLIAFSDAKVVSTF